MQDTHGTFRFGCGLLLLATSLRCADADEMQLPTRLRRPTALLVIEKDGLLLTANRRSGSISVVDVRRKAVMAEFDVGQGLADVVALPGEKLLLAVDEKAGQLIVLNREGARLDVVERLDVGVSPVSVCITPDARAACVANLWARRLTFVSLSEPAAPTIDSVLDLPFAPREQQLLADGRQLVAADAFGGKLAVIDCRERRIVATHELPAHNLRGLALSPDGGRLLVAHQLLNPLSTTDGESVHWGGVMKNLLHLVDTTAILQTDADLDTAGSRYYLGYPDRAAGDPGDLLIAADGRRVVAFSGVGEVAISDVGANYFRRVPVGRRPTALALGSNDTVWVANQLSDTVTQLDLKSAKILAEVSLGPQPQLTASDRGELLFYDATLSRDGWYSCHACHTDGHTNSLASDNFGDETYGAPKLTPTLLGVAETGPWAWNGGASTLPDQIRKSIEITMQGESPSPQQVDDLAAYLATLAAPPSVTDARGERDASAARRGQEVFARQGCIDCHTATAFTTQATYDVGLADELGARQFNPPSLRGASQRERFLHDGRSRTLREAIEVHQTNALQDLDKESLADLLEYLGGL
ncbi:MAG: cytochrome c peroxidase [Pirellulaceae bacterium]